VTVIELMDRILPMVDQEITVEVTKMLRGLGITILTEAKVTRISGNTVHYELAGAAASESGEKILMSVGRAPNTEGLNLDGLGIAMNRRAIKVDKAMQTNIPGIYAIGDVNGTSMLAHTASMEGLVAVDNILGHAASLDYDKIPSCIYIQPEIAAVGLTEEQARQKYGEVLVGKFPLAANGKAMVQGETRGLIKVILEPKYQEILGVHIYGPHATDLISEVSLAMNLEATAEEIAMSVHPHPTLSEIVPEAFHAALGKAIHNF
jgi:dihydrolipoamide dehydrogenase